MVAALSISPARTSRRGRAIPVRIVESVDGQDLLDASIALAHTQLVGQLADEAGVDARTMGTLGFLGALLAVDIAAADLLGAAWWVALITIGLAAICCLGPVLGIGLGASRRTDFGPDPAAFYSRYDGWPSTIARRQLLAELVSAFMSNASRLRIKQRALGAALAVLTVGLVASTFVAGLERVTPIGGTHERTHSRA